MTAPPIHSPQLFSILSGLVAEASGLHFDLGHMPVFLDKVAERAAEAGFDSLLDYYYFLRYDEGGKVEMTALIDALVVGETYLFRELPPLELVVSRFLAPAVAVGGRPRVWCAACATGEEPHTLAMLLASQGLLAHVDLVASDISTASLSRARAGQFSRRAIRGAIPPFASPWLEQSGDRVAASPRLTQAIDWRRVNLIDDEAVSALGRFDLVICRNVLIYFNDQTTRRVLRRLQATLSPEGILVVGISESLLRFGTSLACEEQGGVFFYRNVPAKP